MGQTGPRGSLPHRAEEQSAGRVRLGPRGQEQEEASLWMEASLSARHHMTPFSAGTTQRVYGAESGLGLLSRLSGCRFEPLL